MINVIAVLLGFVIMLWFVAGAIFCLIRGTDAFWVFFIPGVLYFPFFLRDVKDLMEPPKKT